MMVVVTYAYTFVLFPRPRKGRTHERLTREDEASCAANALTAADVMAEPPNGGVGPEGTPLPTGPRISASV